MIVSLEAIFLSTLVMISQNRQVAHDRETQRQDLEADLKSEQMLEHLTTIIDTLSVLLENDDKIDMSLIQEVVQFGPYLKQIYSAQASIDLTLQKISLQGIPHDQDLSETSERGCNCSCERESQVPN
jgi:uncharacterized membrane protein